MKINFSAVTMKPTLSGPTVTRNVYKDVAEAVYQNAQNLEQSRLANRLYEADGEIEVSESEVAAIKASLSAFRWWVQEPIFAMLESNK